jgi:hypothetical protein
MNSKKKPKGGAQKAREKKEKERQSVASSCTKLSGWFIRNAPAEAQASQQCDRNKKTSDDRNARYPDRERSPVETVSDNEHEEGWLDEHREADLLAKQAADADTNSADGERETNAPATRCEIDERSSDDENDGHSSPKKARHSEEEQSQTADRDHEQHQRELGAHYEADLPATHVVDARASSTDGERETSTPTNLRGINKTPSDDEEDGLSSASSSKHSEEQQRPMEDTRDSEHEQPGFDAHCEAHLPGRQAVHANANCADGETSASINLFDRPASKSLSRFLASHPVQPDGHDRRLPFNRHEVLEHPDGRSRKWVSYSKCDRALFCYICMAFDPMSKSPFITGMKDMHRSIQRVKEHESSKRHQEATTAFLVYCKQGSLDTLIVNADANLRYRRAVERRKIVNRIVDIVRTIGKRGLSYRGSKESILDLKFVSADHGNFLELVLLVAKYDQTLRSHLDGLIEDAQERQHRGKAPSKATTFVSKRTVNAIFEAFRVLIRRKIVEKVNHAKAYTLQLDTTQDVSVVEQCAMLVRFVDEDGVHENLLALRACESTTGESIFRLIKQNLDEAGIDISNCVGNSTDGASNMQGAYKGFDAWLSKESPGQVHIWCQSHCLNLAMIQSTTGCVEAVGLFGTLNTCGVFFRESYKRMGLAKKWNNTRMPQLANDTRWWSKDGALSSVFGKTALDY